jgi:hypothetical protein
MNIVDLEYGERFPFAVSVRDKNNKTQQLHFFKDKEKAKVYFDSKPSQWKEGITYSILEIKTILGEMK